MGGSRLVGGPREREWRELRDGRRECRWGVGPPHEGVAGGGVGKGGSSEGGVAPRRARVCGMRGGWPAGPFGPVGPVGFPFFFICFVLFPPFYYFLF